MQYMWFSNLYATVRPIRPIACMNGSRISDSLSCCQRYSVFQGCRNRPLWRANIIYFCMVHYFQRNKNDSEYDSSTNYCLLLRTGRDQPSLNPWEHPAHTKVERKERQVLVIITYLKFIFTYSFGINYTKRFPTFFQLFILANLQVWGVFKRKE